MKKAIHEIPWGGIFQVWATQYAASLEWTIRWMETEDLVQEFALAFVKCQQSIIRTGRARIEKDDFESYSKTLFAMFKTACKRRMLDLLRSHTIVRGSPGEMKPLQIEMSAFVDEAGSSTLPTRRARPSWIDAEMSEAVADAPEPVRAFIMNHVFADEQHRSESEIEKMVGSSMTQIRRQLREWGSSRLILLENTPSVC